MNPTFRILTISLCLGGLSSVAHSGGFSVECEHSKRGFPSSFSVEGVQISRGRVKLRDYWVYGGHGKSVTFEAASCSFWTADKVMGQPKLNIVCSKDPRAFIYSTRSATYDGKNLVLSSYAVLNSDRYRGGKSLRLNAEGCSITSPSKFDSGPSF